MYLDRIETGLTRQTYGIAERTRHTDYLVLFHPADYRRRIYIESRRSGNGSYPAYAAVRHISAMPQLYRGGSPLAVNGIGNAAQSGNYLRAHPKLAFERQAALFHRRISQSGHTYAPGSHAAVVFVQHIGR